MSQSHNNAHSIDCKGVDKALGYTLVSENEYLIKFRKLTYKLCKNVIEQYNKVKQANFIFII